MRQTDLQVFLANIGRKLAIRRHQLALKQANITNATNISGRILSQIENGRYASLNIKTLLKLCDYLEINFNELWGGRYKRLVVNNNFP